MILKTDRLVLRPWKYGDEKELVKIANNKKIAANLVDSFPSPYTLKKAKEWIKSNQNKDSRRRVFVVTCDNKIIGAAGFSIKKNHKKQIAHISEIGYWYGEEYWGKGYASEVLKVLTKYAFKNFPFERIEAKVYTWNPASKKVLEKCGYTFEGTLRKNAVKKGKTIDEWLYSIIRNDLKDIK